jgi:hypothetical protein
MRAEKTDFSIGVSYVASFGTQKRWQASLRKDYLRGADRGDQLRRFAAIAYQFADAISHVAPQAELLSQ